VSAATVLSRLCSRPFVRSKTVVGEQRRLEVKLQVSAREATAAHAMSSQHGLVTQGVHLGTDLHRAAPGERAW
jgi:hypothetical protein